MLEVSEQPAEPLTWKKRLRNAWSSYGLSLILHAAVLLMMALWIVQSHELLWFEPITASFEDVESIATAEVTIPLELPAPQDELDKLFASSDVSSITELEEEPVNVTLQDFGNAPTGGSGLEGLGSGGTGGGAGFFGASAEGNSFVFIVDISSSMQSAFQDDSFHGRPPQTRISRWEKARRELLQSIKNLKPTQKFSVFLYSTGMSSYPQTSRMVSANTRNKMRLSRWVSSHHPGGGTDPRESIRRALEMEPDAIFFLTDGAIPTDSRDVARLHNQSDTVIHTIAIGSQRNLILEQIAEDHGGAFRGVGYNSYQNNIAFVSPNSTPGQTALPSAAPSTNIPGHSHNATPQKPLNLICLVDDENTSLSRYLKLEKRLASLKSKVKKAGLPWHEFEASSILMHNAASETGKFGRTLQHFLKTTQGQWGGHQHSVSVGLLGIDIPLEEIKTAEVKQLLATAEKRTEALNSLFRPKKLSGYSDQIGYIYVFGDPDARQELLNSLEVYNLYNGSKLKIVDGDEALK
ncbi:MAG: hypothetical protein HUJ26_07970 [Planctomycetaceae bacterium]|nr:hypothetical protein [Planctomycetaceae bacterium]